LASHTEKDGEKISEDRGWRLEGSKKARKAKTGKQRGEWAGRREGMRA